MRCLASLLLLSLAAGAEPPGTEDFVRLRGFRDGVQARYTELQEREQFDAKPREEKMLIAFRKGDARFEGRDLPGKLAVKTCLKWAEVQRAQPTAAGQRVLDLLPVVLRERYAVTTDRKERREDSNLLVDALDSEFLPIRRAAIESLRVIYGVPGGHGYDPSLPGKERSGPIKAWKKYVAKRNA